MSPNIKLVLFKKKKIKSTHNQVLNSRPLGTWAPLLPVQPVLTIDHVMPKKIYIQFVFVIYETAKGILVISYFSGGGRGHPQPPPGTATEHMHIP